jgi:heptosyltransferase I
MPPLRELLVLRLTSLGDVLMSLPAVKAIKEGVPEVRITWVVEGSVGELVAKQPFVDSVIRFPRSLLWASLRKGHVLTVWRHLKEFSKNLRERRYDVLLDFHGILKSVLIGRLVRAGRKIGFSKRYAKEGSWLAYDEKVDGTDARLHKVERNMLLARHLGVNGPIPEIELSVPESAEAYVREMLEQERIEGPMIALFPFCSKGSAFKRWELANYAELIKLMRPSIQTTVLILWGPGEEEEARQLRDMAGTGILCPYYLDVTQLCALLKKADLYVGGDTGVMHLAAFAGTPVLAIFGPTDPKVNAPFGEVHKIVRRDIPCSPCKDKECAERACLRTITPAEVFEEVQGMWNRVKDRAREPEVRVQTAANDKRSTSNGEQRPAAGMQGMFNFEYNEPAKRADDQS